MEKKPRVRVDFNTANGTATITKTAIVKSVRRMLESNDVTLKCSVQDFVESIYHKIIGKCTLSYVSFNLIGVSTKDSLYFSTSGGIDYIEGDEFITSRVAKWLRTIESDCIEIVTDTDKFI